MNWTVSELDLCSSAILPEKIGVDELALITLEDRTADGVKDALSLVEALPEPTPTVAVKAMVPRLPAETVKAIEEIRAKLPKAKEKLKALLQLDEAGEPTWRKQMEQEIIARNQAVKIETKSCKGCQSKIATAHIRTYLCPVCLDFPFLATETDKKDFTAREEKIQTLQAEVEGADQKIAELQAEGLAQSEDFRRVWLVFKAS